MCSHPHRLFHKQNSLDVQVATEWIDSISVYSDHWA